MTTFSATAARDDFAKILDLVTVSNIPVGITRYGNLVAKIVPNKFGNESNWKELVSKYAGMWAKDSWTDKIGKSARKFTRNNPSL